MDRVRYLRLTVAATVAVALAAVVGMSLVRSSGEKAGVTSGTGSSPRAIPVAEPAPVVEKGRSAPAPLLDESRDARRRAAVGIARQQLGGEPSPWVLILGRQHLRPIHPGNFELLGSHVMPQRWLPDAVQV